MASEQSIRDTIANQLGAPMRPLSRSSSSTELPRHSQREDHAARHPGGVSRACPTGDVTALENPAAVEAIAQLGLDEETF
jgi:hypothetical protein